MAAVFLQRRKAEDVLQTPPLTSWCGVELFLATDSKQRSSIVCCGDWREQTNVSLFLPFPCLWASEQLVWCEVLCEFGDREMEVVSRKKKKEDQSSGDDRGPVWAGKEVKEKNAGFSRDTNSKHMVDSFWSSEGNDNLNQAAFVYVCFLAGCLCCKTARTRPWTQRWVETSFTSRTAGFRSSLALSLASYDRCPGMTPVLTVELQVRKNKTKQTNTFHWIYFTSDCPYCKHS